MRRHRQRTAPEDGVADAGIGAALKWGDDDIVAPDMDDFALPRTAAAPVFDDVAEPGDVGKSVHLVVRG